MAITYLLEQLKSRSDWLGPSTVQHVEVETCPTDYEKFLASINGCIAFNGALRFFGTSSEVLPSIASWNQLDTWRRFYEPPPAGLLFFAEDPFGDQFAFSSKGVVRFSSETGDSQVEARSFGNWLERILGEAELRLNLGLFRAWQELGNALDPNDHLCSTYPLVLRHNVEVDKLYVLDRIKSMRFKAETANQLKNVPDGTPIKIRIVP